MQFSMRLYLCSISRIKKRQGKTHRESPENLLLVYALIGPFGAFAAMQIFRHKTLKMKFFLVPGFMVLHGIILIRILIFVDLP